MAKKHPQPYQGRGIHFLRDTTLLCWHLTTPASVSAGLPRATVRLALAHSTLDLVTGSTGAVYYPWSGVQPATGRSYSTLVRRWHRSIANSLEPSVAFTRPLHRCFVLAIRFTSHRHNVYLSGKVHIAQGNKKPLHLRGLASMQIPLISRYYPPELAPSPRLCRGVAGLHRAVSLHLS